MITRFTRKIAGLSALGMLALTVTAPIAQAQSSSPPAPAESSSYDRAQAELPGDMYVLYRIVERMARANGLDDSPWRVEIVPTYDNYAFATQPNRVAVHRGLLDQLAGDPAAIACVVAHEMGHSVKQHIALGEEARAVQQAQLAEQLSQQMVAQSQQMTRRANGAATAGNVVGTLGGFLGFLGPLGVIGGSVLSGVGGAISQGAMGDPSEEIQEQMDAYYEQVAQLNEKFAAAARQQELEADEAGYRYTTQAGFEPQGCLRAMAVLSRIPNAEPDADQPSLPDRITAMQQLIDNASAAALVAEGQAKLTGTQPLPYSDLSREGNSLRVNARSPLGGTGEQPGGMSEIDRLLGR
ncbi:M48 family metalloprotease [Leptolyngbya ohadii]|uniref:M48 family metalloprotease n=1 Tax=Leptolyngbya ohadii TaxID=1962290 RepID=UPI000B5A10C3|nr:M48 family metalloprotease [Leptolyngbya ohadii]